MNISMTELLAIIGEKEAQIYLLKAQLAEALKALEDLRPKIESKEQ